MDVFQKVEKIGEGTPWGGVQGQEQGDWTACGPEEDQAGFVSAGVASETPWFGVTQLSALTSSQSLVFDSFLLTAAHSRSRGCSP